MPQWGKSVEFKSGMGYKDNLLLNRQKTESSLLFQNALSFSLVRVPSQAGADIQLFASAEDTRFPDGGTVKGEQEAGLFFRIRQDFSDAWKIGLSAQCLHQDHMADASITETNPLTVHAVGQTLRFRPSVRRALPQGFWLEAEPSVTRQFFNAPLDDYWEGGNRLSLGRDYGRKSEAALHWHFNRRFYDARPQTAADGSPLSGSRLRSGQHAAEVSLRHYWDEARRWRTVAKIGGGFYEDNGSGFFDHDKLWFSHQIRYASKNWTLACQLQISRYAYGVQPAENAASGKRLRHDGLFRLEAERHLASWLKCFAEFEREQTFSNRRAEKYDANTVFGGFIVEF